MIQLPYYQINVKGHLDPRWSEWFDGLKISHKSNGETVLAGPVRDQAALFGLLYKIHSLNLSLISLNRLEPASAETDQPAGGENVID